jgi:hypothetical protein
MVRHRLLERDHAVLLALQRARPAAEPRQQLPRCLLAAGDLERQVS